MTNQFKLCIPVCYHKEGVTLNLDDNKITLCTDQPEWETDELVIWTTPENQDFSLKVIGDKVFVCESKCPNACCEWTSLPCWLECWMVQWICNYAPCASRINSITKDYEILSSHLGLWQKTANIFEKLNVRSEGITGGDATSYENSAALKLIIKIFKELTNSDIPLATIVNIGCNTNGNTQTTICNCGRQQEKTTNNNNVDIITIC